MIQLEELCNLIDKEITQYRHLLSLAWKEGRCLKDKNISEISEIIKEKECILSKIKGLDIIRKKCVEEIVNRLSLNGRDDITFSELIKIVKGPCSLRLKKLRDEFIRITQELEELNRTNTLLVEHLLEYTHDMVKIFTTFYNAGVYNQSGEMISSTVQRCDSRA